MRRGIEEKEEVGEVEKGKGSLEVWVWVSEMEVEGGRWGVIRLKKMEGGLE